MKDHYDICVAGFWYGWNYGSLLNGYAEYRLLKEFGRKVLMLQKPYRVKEPDAEILRLHNARFIERRYDPEDVSPNFLYTELPALNERCDSFCAGSDQIWNYNLSFHENMYLPFVRDGKKLISFATSFGHSRDKVPDEAKPRIRGYLQRYSAISVREQFDVDILHNNYGLNGELVFEPVFCLDQKYYRELADASAFQLPDRYLLTYLLDPTPEKRDAAQYYAAELGLKMVNLLDGSPSNLERNRGVMNLPDTFQDVDAEDLLKAFMNAAYVVTDSFHGTAFSVIFNKPFLSIGNYGRGYERFPDLLGRIGLIDRLADPRAIPKERKYLEAFDYAPVNEIVRREAARTVEWFRRALDTPSAQLPKVAYHNIYADLERVRIMTALIKAYGIRHVVLSSGTRNVSLARMFEANEDFFKIYRITDERSAAYFALGLSTRLHEPIAICCTSGTAVANYVPAVTEAFYMNVPLLVITADRHPSLHGNLEDQTITQYGLFQTISKKAVTLPVNLDAKNMWEAKVKICDAILEMTHHGCGPVQINVPQSGIERRPTPRYALILPQVKKITRITTADSEAVWMEAFTRLTQARRVMVVYGQTPRLSAEDQALIDAFAQKFNCVILTDHLSNLYGERVVFPYRLLNKLDQKEYNRALTPDLVIQLGGKRILNDPLTSKLRNGSGNVDLWRVAEDGRVADLYRRLCVVWECSSRQFLTFCLAHAPQEAQNDGQYYAAWQQKMALLPPDTPNVWKTRYTLYHVMRKLPKNSMVHLAVGNSFVNAQLFPLDPSIEVFCNMGTNGIDGCSSTFVGQAISSPPDQMCFLFVGDLSFFYDMNSLWNKKLSGNVRILLNNDGGAGLLRYHESPGLTQEHGAIAEGWVKSLGFAYLSAKNKEEFHANLDRFVTPGGDVPIFFETFVP